MQTRIIEATSPAGNWGKFLVGIPDVEWERRVGLFDVAREVVDEECGEGAYDELAGPRPAASPLLAQLGWSRRHIWVLDLQTGEGACFLPGGVASADLRKHRIWVCPLFEPFLAWLYTQPVGPDDLDSLPAVVEIDVPFQWQGHRYPGPDGPTRCHDHGP